MSQGSVLTQSSAQVETAFRDLCRFTELDIAVLYGGVGYGRQLEQLKKGVDIIVATPGRLLDHLQRGTGGNVDSATRADRIASIASAFDPPRADAYGIEV